MHQDNFDPSKFPSSENDRIVVMLLMIEKAVSLIGFGPKVMPLVALKAELEKH